MNESFVCLHLNDCRVFVQSDVLRIWMDFKLVDVRWFCFHINLHAYTVILLFKVLFMTVWIKNWFRTPWSEVCQIKCYFHLPDWYFLPHIRLLPQHLQNFVLQFFYSICFSFFLDWICLENEFKAQCNTETCAYNENSLYHTYFTTDNIAKMINSSTLQIIFCSLFQTLKLMDLSANIYRPKYGNTGT